MDSTQWRERAGSFGPAAVVYDRSRPSYPVEAVRYVLPEGVNRVLDLAAGTGKLTGVLLDLGLDVVAVEPSAQMRELIPARAQVLDGTAESIPLPDGSLDAVLVGQAFHWFDTAAALTEIARVLRPGGTLGLLWNVRDDSPEWVRAVWDLFAEDTVDGAPFQSQSGLGAPALELFDNSQQLDADLLVDLVASRSAVLTMPDAERTAVLERARELAPDDDTFDLDYRCEAWRSVRA